MPNDPPAGWKLVPVEPTETMIRAFDVILPDHWTVRARHAWACALAAAPEPPAAPPDAMRERVRVLEEALRPFALDAARYAERFDFLGGNSNNLPGDYPPPSNTSLVWADFRRARAALEPRRG